MAGDWNTQIIEEFRANHGKVGGFLAAHELLLLTTTGAKSGLRRTTPLVFIRDGDDIVVVASDSGAATNPAWFHNIRVNPEVTLEVGGEVVQARAAAITEGPDRDRLFAAMVEEMDRFAGYQDQTDRVIPVVKFTLH
ncbi:nitroreductase/quinone reductase family protein [Nocardia sp. CNY236]|uniref:nitroreductase/quinone reductase family protein n=1 Tax=Nocardia sp. CNY236 TaxID=1169152 RepID=UPI0003F6C91E|nr:nitroreductase/quinone reductase family protein [Nocardia sp. CNY236]